MVEIGDALRERRIREKIDVQQVEDATKIRAKYLRALENEEFDLLPGHAYIKSFLRTYADYLGLDGRELVDAYKNRFEGHDEAEQPIFPARPEPGGHERARRRRRGLPAAVLLLAVVIAGVLVAVGAFGGRDGESAGTRADGGDGEAPAGRSNASGSAATGDSGATRAAAGPSFAFALSARGAVWVCVVDAAGRQRVPGRVLAPGDRTRAMRSTSFTVRLGSGDVVFTFGDSRRRIPRGASPVAFRVTAGGVKSLPLREGPTCS